MAGYEKLIERSQWLRQEIFDMVINAQQGHIPSCFSFVEVIVALYYGGVARFNRANANDPDRDRIVVSKGHAAMGLYPVLADIGFFSKEELKKFTQPGGLLGMYADIRIPGIEGISGSLGHGVGMGAGFALAARMAGKQNRSFVIVGDGECYEGSIWEGALFAAHKKLDNLVTIVDRNQMCILGPTEDCLELGDLEEKWRSFGWEAVSVDGHSYASLMPAFEKIGKTNGKPLAIIANTAKGKGISFMELKLNWHNRMPNAEQVAQARQELTINCIKN